MCLSILNDETLPPEVTANKFYPLYMIKYKRPNISAGFKPIMVVNARQYWSLTRLHLDY